MALARLQMTQCCIEALAAYACSNGVFPVFLIRIKIICTVLVNKSDRHLSCGTLGHAFRNDMDNFFVFIVFSIQNMLPKMSLFGEIVFILTSWTLILVPAYNSISLLCLKSAAKHLNRRYQCKRIVQLNGRPPAETSKQF